MSECLRRPRRTGQPAPGRVSLFFFHPFRFDLNFACRPAGVESLRRMPAARNAKTKGSPKKAATKKPAAKKTIATPIKKAISQSKKIATPIKKAINAKKAMRRASFGPSKSAPPPPKSAPPKSGKTPKKAGRKGQGDPIVVGQSLMPGLVIEGLIDEDGAGSKLYSVTGGGLFVFNQKSGSGYRLYTHVCEEARRSQMCCARREHVCLLVYGRFCVLPFPFACLCAGEFLLPSPFLSAITLTRAQCSHSQLLMPDPESGLDSDGASSTSALPLPPTWLSARQ